MDRPGEEKEGYESGSTTTPSSSSSKPASLAKTKRNKVRLQLSRRGDRAEKIGVRGVKTFFSLKTTNLPCSFWGDLEKSTELMDLPLFQQTISHDDHGSVGSYPAPNCGVLLLRRRLAGPGVDDDDDDA